MALITFISIFYLFMVTLLFFLFFVEKDDWFKMFHFVSFITMIALMIHLCIFQTSIDNDFGLVVESIVLDDMSLDNLDLFNDEEISVTDEFHQFRFDNIRDKFEREVVDADFCFYYNNTDDANAIKIVSITNEVSDFIYLEGMTSNFVCTDINESLIKDSSLFGVSCADCTGGNTLWLMSDNNSPDTAFEVVFDKANPLSYLVNQSVPHVFWLEVIYLPKEQVNKNFELFLFFLATYLMFYMMRFFYKFVKEGTDYNV